MLFATLTTAFFLREPVSRWRWTSAALIAGGIMVMKGSNSTFTVFQQGRAFRMVTGHHLSVLDCSINSRSGMAPARDAPARSIHMREYGVSGPIRMDRPAVCKAGLLGRPRMIRVITNGC